MYSDLTINGQDLDIAYTPCQYEFFFAYNERFKVLHKGRRFGATSSCAGYAIEMLIEGKTILWVDTIQSNLDKYYTRYFYPILKQIDPKYWSYRTQQKLLLIGNAHMDFRSAEIPQNIEGFGYHIIIINEAGIVLKGQKGRDLWYNTIYPMVLDFQALVYFVGTPKGKKAKKDEIPHKTSLYYDLACKCGLDGHEKNENWRRFNFSSYDNPLLLKSEIKELEDEVPRVVREQEIKGRFIDINDEAIFKASWFHIVYELPPVVNRYRRIISMDTAFKKGSENDDSAGVVILETRNGYFIEDMFCEKLEFPELIKKSNEFYDTYNTRDVDNIGVSYVLIEDKASGTPLIQTYQRLTTHPVKPIQVDKDKCARWCACSPLFDTGKVFLMFGAWNKTLIDHMCDLNAALDTPDDIGDALSQGLNYLKKKASPLMRIVTGKRKYISEALSGY